MNLIQQHDSSLALAAACLAWLLFALPAAAVEAGEPAPDFERPQIGAVKQLSLSDFRGKVVYLDFWASWCAPCAVSLPIVDSFREEFGPDEFAVLAVNVDSDLAKAKTFLRRRPVGYPSVSDPEGEIPVRFGVETMPTAFLIDRQGVIRAVHRGFKKSDEDALRSQIRKLVSGR
jgi:peroxiredoxin